MRSKQQPATLAPAMTGSVYPLRRGDVELSPSGRTSTPGSQQVTQLELDPTRVRPWAGNARFYDCLTAANCNELITSMRSAGGQKFPAILRQIYDDPLHDYEVIIGSRRHFAVRWLRANGHPDMKFIGVAQVMTDEEAFLRADAENRVRKDVSNFERARNYAEALEAHFDGKQARMAERLGVSKSWLSKTLCVAAVPDTVLDAFADLSAVSVATFYPVAQLMQNSDAAAAIHSEAQAIAAEQEDRSWGFGTPISAPEVIRRLKAAASSQKAESHEKASAKPRPIVSVMTSDSQEVTLRLQSDSGATRDEVLQAVATALDALHANGQRLWL